jgi:NAD(P)-dependent dehydrogenase (short-subunit alcohol dehydrogenase family)
MVTGGARGIGAAIAVLAGARGYRVAVASRVPLGRMAGPCEIAEAVSWLLSPQVPYVTGSVLRVGGGL